VTALATARPVPKGPAFDVVLVAHVAVVLIGFGSCMITGIFGFMAWRGPGPLHAGVRRYFRPGPTVAGRAIYLVPVFGATLLILSHGVFTIADGWVLAGLALWVVAVALGEGVLWPATARASAMLTGARASRALATDARGAHPRMEAAPGEAEMRRLFRTVSIGAAGIVACGLAGIVLMFAKPSL